MAINYRKTALLIKSIQAWEMKEFLIILLTTLILCVIIF